MKPAVFVLVAMIALAVGAFVAVESKRVPTTHSRTVEPGDDFVVTDLTTIALGHRRAVEFLHADESRAALFEAATRASRAVVRVVCRGKVRLLDKSTGDTGSGDWHNYGCGTVVGRRLVLTAAHVLATPSAHELMEYEDGHPSVLLVDGREAPATIVARGADGGGRSADWLLLDVGSDAPTLPPAVRLGAPESGRLVVSIGYGGDAGLATDGSAYHQGAGVAGEPTWMVGRITAAAGVTIEPLAGCCPPGGGSSGGPVVDETGNVVAIHVGWDSETREFDLGAVPGGPRHVNVSVEYTLTAVSVAAAARFNESATERPR